MGMNPDTGELRPLADKEDLKEGEVLFTVGELVSLKGCVFSVKEIYPNPDNELVLVGRPKSVEDQQSCSEEKSPS